MRKTNLYTYKLQCQIVTLSTYWVTYSTLCFMFFRADNGIIIYWLPQRPRQVSSNKDRFVSDRLSVSDVRAITTNHQNSSAGSRNPASSSEVFEKGESPHPLERHDFGIDFVLARMRLRSCFILMWSNMSEIGPFKLRTLECYALSHTPYCPGTCADVLGRALGDTTLSLVGSPLACLAGAAVL